MKILDILIIVAEVSLIILAFSVFHWLIGKLFKQLVRFAWLRKGDRSTRALRRKIRGMLVLHCLMLCVLVVAVNLWLIYQGNNLQEYTLEVITPISPDFWRSFAIGAFQSAGIVIVALISMAIVYPILDIACNRAKKFEYITSNDDSIEEFFSFLKNNLTNIVWLSVAIGCTQLLQVPAIVSQFLYIGLKIYAILAAGLLIFKAVAAIIDSLDALSNKYSNPDNFLRFYDHLRHLVPFLKRSLEYAIYVYMATLVVQQLELVADLAAYGPRIARVIGIIFISRIFVEVANLVIEEALLKNKKL
ncbi:MAG: mechanosensitive ion channel family protein, partial [Merismopedia sp. SIO2A8]|nr:mechanosensitive ion channel family protein [Merismopedia sp. SIO2A8]